MSSVNPALDVVTIIVLGASGDLAKKKTFPALFDLFNAGLLPPPAPAGAFAPAPAAAVVAAPALQLFGYARSASTDVAFREMLRPYLSGGAAGAADAFLSLCRYRAGGYDAAPAMAALDAELAALEDAAVAARGGSGAAHRLFYLAVPPSVFPSAAATVKATLFGARAGSARAATPACCRTTRAPT